ncbi:hypothetical protein OQA88_8352 [Cercophora sp. LCS_1]
MNTLLRRLPRQIGAPQTTACYSHIPLRALSICPVRPLSTTRSLREDEYEAKARKLNQKGLDDHEKQVQVRQRQVHRPWHRQNADKPPVQEQEDTEPVVKGKLLTTPTRLLKLILPMPISIEKDIENNDARDYGRSISSNDKIQPLALLIHPQQPLSYVERLIQAEIPPVKEDGKEKIPNVYFRAEDADEADNRPTSKSEAKSKETSPSSSTHVESYSGLGHEGPEREASDKNWVRWSSSTEVGDFIRDAARGREFAIEIEGHGVELRVTVPSFNDRTYYMRVQLRKMSRKIDQLAHIKKECDLIAHRSAHRLAKGGFALLTGWWGVVYYFSFHTNYGWDLMEPITYLTGLATIMGGYLWFLYISRDLSYKAAMNVTVSRRQNALYEERGFDIQRWEQMVREANALRSEIKVIAVEYDVEWDDAKDVGEEVKEVLDKEKSKKKDKSRSSEKEEDENLTGDQKRKEKPEKGDKTGKS